jgi:hypothetical protein
MDDIMTLMHKIYIDLQGFNELQFGIFNSNEQEVLKKHFYENKGDINVFISFLSPEQKEQITNWAISRTEYNTKELELALKTFLKYLKSYNSKTYPCVSKKNPFFRKKQ